MTSASPKPSPVNNFWYTYNKSKAVFVFVHGIFSDSKVCWLHREKTSGEELYWPDLVNADKRLEHPSIFMAGYATSINSGDLGIRECARRVFDALQTVDPKGHQPPLSKPHIIFICHSTGGIVARYMLEREKGHFKDKMVGLVLLASPSLGSIYANKLTFLAKFYNQKLGLQLRWGGESLDELDDRFRRLVFERNKYFAGFTGVEAYEHFFVLRRDWLPAWLDRFLPNRRRLVDRSSAGQYFGAPRSLEGTDHFLTAKPDGLRHPSHELIVNFWNNEFKPLVRGEEKPEGRDNDIPTDERSTEVSMHPRDKSFTTTAEWSEQGLTIRGGNIVIPPNETKALFESWLKHLPVFVAQETPKSRGPEEASEKAYLLATLRACYDVYGAVPDEEEMKRGSSVRSRKLNLFYAFAKDAYSKASRNGVSLAERLQNPSAKGAVEEEPTREQRQLLIRTMLRMYVYRVCDLALDEVERFENGLQNFPPWEPLVEKVYDVDEEKVLEMVRAAKSGQVATDETEIADAVIAFIITSQYDLDDISFEN